MNQKVKYQELQITIHESQIFEESVDEYLVEELHELNDFKDCHEEKLVKKEDIERNMNVLYNDSNIYISEDDIKITLTDSISNEENNVDKSRIFETQSGKVFYETRHNNKDLFCTCENIVEDLKIKSVHQSPNESNKNKKILENEKNESHGAIKKCLKKSGKNKTNHRNSLTDCDQIPTIAILNNETLDKNKQNFIERKSSEFQEKLKACNSDNMDSNLKNSKYKNQNVSIISLSNNENTNMLQNIEIQKPKCDLPRHTQNCKTLLHPLLMPTRKTLNDCSAGLEIKNNYDIRKNKTELSSHLMSKLKLNYKHEEDLCFSLPSSPNKDRKSHSNGNIILTSEVFTRTVDATGSGFEVVYKEPSYTTIKKETPITHNRYDSQLSTNKIGNISSTNKSASVKQNSINEDQFDTSSLHSTNECDMKPYSTNEKIAQILSINAFSPTRHKHKFQYKEDLSGSEKERSLEENTFQESSEASGYNEPKTLQRLQKSTFTTGHCQVEQETGPKVSLDPNSLIILPTPIEKRSMTESEKAEIKGVKLKTRDRKYDPKKNEDITIESESDIDMSNIVYSDRKLFWEHLSMDSKSLPSTSENTFKETQSIMHSEVKLEKNSQETKDNTDYNNKIKLEVKDEPESQNITVIKKMFETDKYELSSKEDSKNVIERTIKNEIRKEQMMQQPEDGSPERKGLESLENNFSKCEVSQEQLVSRHIHTHIFSNELNENIESLIPENKYIRNDYTHVCSDEEKEEEQKTSGYYSDFTKEKSIEEISHEEQSNSSNVTSVKSKIGAFEKLLSVESETKPQLPLGQKTFLDYKKEKKESKDHLLQQESVNQFSDNNMQVSYRVEKNICMYQGESPSIESVTTHFEKSELEITEKVQNCEKENFSEQVLGNTVWEVTTEHNLHEIIDGEIEEELIASNSSLHHSDTIQIEQTDLKDTGSIKSEKKCLTPEVARNIAIGLIEEIQQRVNNENEKMIRTTEVNTSDLEHTHLQKFDDNSLIRDERVMEVNQESTSQVSSYIKGVLNDKIPYTRKEDDNDITDLNQIIEAGTEVEKTLAEVRESLGAAQDTLLAEKQKKQNDVEIQQQKKRSPSEFEFNLSAFEQKFEMDITHNTKDTKEYHNLSNTNQSCQHTEETNYKQTLPAVSFKSSKNANDEESTQNFDGSELLSKKVDIAPTTKLVDDDLKKDKTELLLLEQIECELVPVILRKTFSQKGDTDSTHSSREHSRCTERKSGTDFEGCSSSGESHYHSFEENVRNTSRPCSSDVEMLILATGNSSEYESALTSQEQSQKSTSQDYHTAVSSLSSRDSMKSLSSESSGHLASIEISSEASETLIPSAMELERDIEDSDYILEDEVVDANEPNNAINNDILTSEVKTQLKNEDIVTDIGETYTNILKKDEVNREEISASSINEKNEKSKMKRSLEMTFFPEPRPVINESPVSETATSLDDSEKLISSLEESILSGSFSSTSDNCLKTIIENSFSLLPNQELQNQVSSGNKTESSLIEKNQIEEVCKMPNKTDEVSETDETHISYEIGTSTSCTSIDQSLKDTNMSDITLMISKDEESGLQNVCTQVSSTKKEDNQSIIPIELEDSKKKGRESLHRRGESISISKGKTILSQQIDYEMFDIDANNVTHNKPKRLPSDSSSGDDDGVAIEDKKSDVEVYEIFQIKDPELKDIIERPLTPEPDALPISSHVDSKLVTMKLESNKCKNATFNESNDKVTPGIITNSAIHEDVGSKSDSSSKTAVLTFPATIQEDEAQERREEEEEIKKVMEYQMKLQENLENAANNTDIPDITVTQHMTPIIDLKFHYPELELQKEIVSKEKDGKSSPPTPASIASHASEKSSDTETDQGREYILTSEQIVLEKQDLKHEEKALEKYNETSSPDSDSFELLDKNEIEKEEIQFMKDDFVIIEEIGKEANEDGDIAAMPKEIPISRGVKHKKKIRNETDDDLLVSSPPPTNTRLTEIKYYPIEDKNSGSQFQIDSENSCQINLNDEKSETSQKLEYQKDVEAGKKWIEMQFQGAEQIYNYDGEYERGPLEDIEERREEEEMNETEPSRTSSKVGSLGSYKDSFSSTPEYDVLAGRKYFTRSGEHDDISMSSLQEFERLEKEIGLENARRQSSSGSQDSLNGSLGKRNIGKGGQGDDISISSLKEFERLEIACIQAEKIEIKAKEEEALLSEIDEGHESQVSESESCTTISECGKESDSDDYDKRMFEIDEIIRQAQCNVEKFEKESDGILHKTQKVRFKHSKSGSLLKSVISSTEGTDSSILDKSENCDDTDSLEESQIPDLDLDTSSQVKNLSTVTNLTKDIIVNLQCKATPSESIKFETRKIMGDKVELPMKHIFKDIECTLVSDVTSTQNVALEQMMSTSVDSIEPKTSEQRDIMHASADSIELENKVMTISSDSLEFEAVQNAIHMSGSIDSIEDEAKGSFSGGQTKSSSSGRDGDLSSIEKDESAERETGPDNVDLMICSTDSLDPSSSTATHATYQYETDSIMSSSFTSGGSATMVSSTETLDQAEAKMISPSSKFGVFNQVLIDKTASAAIPGHFDDDGNFYLEKGRSSTFTDSDGSLRTVIQYEKITSTSKPYVTEVIEPASDCISKTFPQQMSQQPHEKEISVSGSKKLMTENVAKSANSDFEINMSSSSKMENSQNIEKYVKNEKEDNFTTNCSELRTYEEILEDGTVQKIIKISSNLNKEETDFSDFQNSQLLRMDPRSCSTEMAQNAYLSRHIVGQSTLSNLPSGSTNQIRVSPTECGKKSYLTGQAGTSDWTKEDLVGANTVRDKTQDAEVPHSSEEVESGEPTTQQRVVTTHTRTVTTIGPDGEPVTVTETEVIERESSGATDQQ